MNRSFSFRRMGSVLDITLARVLYCLVVFIYSWGVPNQIATISGLGAYTPIPIFQFIGLIEPDRQVFIYLAYGFQIALLGSILGLFTRASLLLALILGFFTFGFVGGFEYNANGFHGHSRAVIFFFLPILCAAPGVGRVGFGALLQGKKWVDLVGTPVKVWPLHLAQFSVGFIYFAVNLVRLKTSGLSWYSGDTLQAYLMQAYFFFRDPLVYKVANNVLFAITGSVVVLVFESTFLFVILFWRKLIPLYMAVGILLHLSVYWFFKINFVISFLPAYVMFLRWVHLRAFFGAFARYWRRTFAINVAK